MAQRQLLGLIESAPLELRAILDSARGLLQPPIRAEIFGPQRFAQHGRSLGETHRAAKASSPTATFFPRLRSNIHSLREAHHYVGLQASTGYDISPAAEWLLDNYPLIEAQSKEIHDGLPGSFFRALPVLLDEPLAGLPRIYGVAWAFVAHTDGAFEEELLIQFLNAYQETRELTLGEMWALPTTLRVVLIENLRRLAEGVAAHQAAREAANLCCDAKETCSTQSLDELLALLNLRGVGSVFLAQMAQRLQDHRTIADSRYPARYHDWLRDALPDLAAVQAQQSANQAADNLSVSNAVTSLRAISDADWPDIVARSSTLMRLMLTSTVFESEAVATRDHTLHDIERLARRSCCSEVQVAQQLLSLMQVTESNDRPRAMASYWLRGAGRSELLRALGQTETVAFQWLELARRNALTVYLATVLLGTTGLVLWLLLQHGTGPSGFRWMTLWGALLMLFPASEAVVAVVNRLISESVRPHHMPRLALLNGIPPEHRVLVVIPAMLTGTACTRELVHRLRLHYLANPECHAQFALLTDWADADTPGGATDQALLTEAIERVRQLNVLYSYKDVDANAAPRFILMHRNRTFCETEQRWIGWERKRGKLELLVAALAQGSGAAFMNLGDVSRIAADTRYIVTLDSDTQLPPGRLRELVGVAAHPQNQPQLATDGRSVVSGYGILQPRLSTPLPAPVDFTFYHWLFAGQCGIDPYSAASSEVYQDLFCEGTFTGKGLLNVRAMHAVLSGRLPQERVLSHDLLEGSIARCAAVTDITVIEDAPFHADVAASRVHRWTRGDWQLLPFLLAPRRYGLRAINCWKMFDNLRRSLVAPMSLLLLLLALTGAVVSPWAALALVLAAFSAGPLMGAVAGFSPTRGDVAKRHFYRQAGLDLVRVLWGGLWHLGQLLQQALLAVDAIARAVYRMAISHRHLLQWTTAAAAQAQARTKLAAVARQHWKEPALALWLFLAYLNSAAPERPLALLLCALWSASPIWTWCVSRRHPTRPDTVLPVSQQAYLEGIARDTWRFFERCVVAGDNHLPPDNLQTTPYDMVAHRTSPTNIGLYLLSASCARQFGWIGTQELLSRLEATLTTMARLQRHGGHFLNWYDTQTCAPLLPMYVSTVDSGNLSGHLLAVAQACLELSRTPHDTVASQRALLASRQRLAPLLGGWPEAVPGSLSNSALARLLAVVDPLAEGRSKATNMEQLLREAEEELTLLWRGSMEAAGQPSATTELAWALGDHLTTLRSALVDVQAHTATDAAGAGAAQTAGRLRAAAASCEQLAWQADFGFLYHSKRHLLHIGYRVAEQQLDAGFYDLLASESRLTSLLAVAKGDVPVRHWTSLGRQFFASGADAGLRSWSGSMFEYLMPGLVLEEPKGSVLREACDAALHEQIAFAHVHDVPWGISESAYAGADYTLAYQYAPQGVPKLALRRTPTDELVIAPYATALAAQLSPHRACANFQALQTLGSRARYGFIEALDFSPARQAHGERFTPVNTFMAHHQGMCIVALSNVLLGSAAQRWGMASAPIEAVASLLHERSPREISSPFAPPMGAPTRPTQRRNATGLLREVLPGAAAVEPTHLLSNGRYCVALRANGAGLSRLGQTGITRWRDDALRDAYGSFFYVRRLTPSIDVLPATPVSITQHPAPDPAANYASSFHADRVCFEASWPDLQAHTTVWVSPEDDIEFRQVELRNLDGRTLELELISAFDVTLTDARADESHPAFTGLFVRAEWQAEHQALVFERKPRIASEQPMLGAHFLSDNDPQVVEVRCQTDRQRWLGRNHRASQPQASFDPLPAAGVDPVPDLDTGLDPVCALAVRLRIAPHAKVLLTFATAASDNAETLHAVIDKYRQPSNVQRASLMSATLAGIRLRALRISAESFAAIQTLTTTLLLSLTRPKASPTRAESAQLALCDRRSLWRLGISGDRPLILVSADVTQSLGLLRSLAQALNLWSWGGVACDLVIMNAEPASYLMPLQREIGVLRDRFQLESSAQAGPCVTGFHLLRANELSSVELSTLQVLARVWLHADGRPLLQHVQEWTALHEQVFKQRDAGSSCTVAAVFSNTATRQLWNGDFAADSGEFAFEVSARLRPSKPWINVLANPLFGTLVSEAGGGYTWAGNSRLNQLTAWSNDPVADPPSEWFLLQDLKTRRVWSVAPNAWADEGTSYQVTHGQGYSVIQHRQGDIEVTASWCVDAEAAVKQVRLDISNRGNKLQRLRLIGMVEWMMGANRSDRNTVHTALYCQRLKATREEKLTALLCTQRDHSAGFGGGTAFFGLTGPVGEDEDWTCDRRECFDARGRLVLPDHFEQTQGDGLDPCAALSTRLALAAGESVQRVFLLGYGESADAARQLVTVAAALPPQQRMQEVARRWDRLLGATQVKTPDPLFDALVNRWLLYQTVSCRLWAKAGFYQAGGATGFRDQLQDAMALAWAAPEMLRGQIVTCASRQFPEGDVQHWWHAPTGVGVRTHFSDDLLWLAYACVHYLRVSDDTDLLDQRLHFIEGITIAEGAEDAYATPSISTADASVYEHCARAIDRSLRIGVHGLPLMGSGDWNDGMNRVGHEGRGESVWLAWFLCQLVADFAPLARGRGEEARARLWESAALGWKVALLGPAWDGRWFKRAFFDDGQALGSHANAEARIDLIAQAWAVLSGVAPADMQRMALAAVEEHLVDHQAGLIRLLDPPLVHAEPSAGYIQAYPPGIRENGGQYSHAGVWALMAQAQASATNVLSDANAAADTAYRYFTYLSPAHRAKHPERGPAYGLEPYVMAGDVYSQPPYVGRGGWSWYTGSAAWMHRAAIESIFGLRQGAQELSFRPCLPTHWQQAELTLERDGRSLRFVLMRATPDAALAAAETLQAQLLRPGQTLRWRDLQAHSCFVIALQNDATPAPDAGRTPAAQVAA